MSVAVASEAQVRVNEIFRIIAPTIIEAYLMTAPQNPGEHCTIAIPIPAGLILDRDRDGLRQAIDALTIVQDVTVTTDMSREFIKPSQDVPAIPGVVITGKPFSTLLSRFEELRKIG